MRPRFPRSTMAWAVALSFLVFATASASAPLPVTDLRITHAGASVALAWTHTDPAAVHYEVWRSSQPYGVPGSANTARLAVVAPGALDAEADVPRSGQQPHQPLRQQHLLRTRRQRRWRSRAAFQPDRRVRLQAGRPGLPSPWPQLQPVHGRPKSGPRHDHQRGSTAAAHGADRAVHELDSYVRHEQRAGSCRPRGPRDGLEDRAGRLAGQRSRGQRGRGQPADRGRAGRRGRYRGGRRRGAAAR